MSLKAGGVGLNLTAASNVFLMVKTHSCPSAFLDSLPTKCHLTLLIKCRIHGGIPQLRNKQLCVFIALVRRGPYVLEGSLSR